MFDFTFQVDEVSQHLFSPSFFGIERNHLKWGKPLKGGFVDWFVRLFGHFKIETRLKKKAKEKFSFQWASIIR
jgi:hypothetical protein